MALCVRRLRGAPGIRSHWKSGIRGAGGAAGRLREHMRVRDAVLFRELRPFPRVSPPLRRPLPLAVPKQRTDLHPTAPRLCPASDKGLQSLRDFLMQATPLPGHVPRAKPGRALPADQECWHFSSSQLDCFRSLFEPGVCRTPYQAMALPLVQEGVVTFTSSKRLETSQVPVSDKSDMEQHLAVMYEKLRDELPSFLWKPANYSLYRKDLEFVSDFMHLHLRGLVKYQLFLTMSRLLLLCYFTNSRISLLKLTSHPENNTIQARWSFTGLPLHMLFFYIFRTDKSELYRTYDAFSTFQLAPDGLISLHKVERVMPSSPITVTKKTILAAALIALGLGEDRPALNLLTTPKLPREL
ncbi:hypothetical protein GDO81_003258 [Engystomops pustulosus]|uniref:Uncharacterized protein n=2 Tax=Engystomops pustulosus TaxID=76066 RepID=A0AAV6ZUU5_ENGPU|nr:hypothetical protein GDO81_003258 [Engystomops pustulosus]